MQRFQMLVMAISMAFSFSACKKGSKSNNADTAKPGEEKGLPVLKSETGTWPTPYWTAKAKVSIEHPGTNLSFNMVLRAEQGKALWFSANAFGLMEVARGMVTEDTVMALDKFNNKCYTGGTNSLKSYVPFEMGLSQLQHFLMGRVFWDSLGLNGMRQVGDSTYVDGIQEDTKFAVATWQKYYLHKAMLNRNGGQMTLFLENSDFRNVGPSKIGFSKTLNSTQLIDKKEEKSGLKIEFSKFEFVSSKPEMPLDLPADCERQAIR